MQTRLNAQQSAPGLSGPSSRVTSQQAHADECVNEAKRVGPAVAKIFVVVGLLCLGLELFFSSSSHWFELAARFFFW